MQRVQTGCNMVGQDVDFHQKYTHKGGRIPAINAFIVLTYGMMTLYVCVYKD